MSLNSLLIDSGSKGWADLFIDTLKVYNGAVFCGDVEIVGNLNIDNLNVESLEGGNNGELLHTNGLGEVVWEDPSNIFDTLYTGDGSLSSNRVIDGDNNDLSLSNINSFSIDSQSISLSNPLNNNDLNSEILSRNSVSGLLEYRSAVSLTGQQGPPVPQGPQGPQGLQGPAFSEGCNLSLGAVALSMASTKLISNVQLPSGYNNGEYNIITGDYTLPVSPALQKYHVDCQAAYAYNGIHPTVDNTLHIKLNGVNISIADNVYPSVINDNLMYQTSFTFQGAANDVLTVYFDISDLGAGQVISGGDLSNFSIHRIL